MRRVSETAGRVHIVGPPRDLALAVAEVYGWRVAVLLEREAELAQLAGLLDSALAGRGGVAIVQGSPGIGKTRVLAS